MCDTNAYIKKGDSEELYLESVDILRPEDGKVYLRNLFGEQKVFEGRLREISFLKRKIILESR
jgi:predicted RNA-binding protein